MDLFSSTRIITGTPVKGVPVFGIGGVDAAASTTAGSSTDTSTTTAVATAADYTAPTPKWDSYAVQQRLQAPEQARNTVQKKNIGILGIILLSVVALAQTDNTFYVRNFAGKDVGQKLGNALAQCNTDVAVPCILVIDPSLSKWPNGTWPGLPANANIIDYRKGVTPNPTQGTPLSVKSAPFNAVGDGVTPDTNAVQAALDSARAQNAPVYFPSGTFLVCNLVYHGQNMSGAGVPNTIIRSQPGCDIFQGQDAAETYPEQLRVSDMKLQVDVSIDSSATAAGGNNTFPNRISGTLYGTTPFPNPPQSYAAEPPSVAFADAQFTSGSNSVYVPDAQFLSVPASFFVGRTFTSTAASLSTTITAVTDNSHITLQANSGATVTGDGVISATAVLQAPWYFGACAFAFPASDGSAVGNGIIGAQFENLRIEQYGGTRQNQGHACGFFFQRPPYSVVFSNVKTIQLYGGIIEAPPVTGNAAYYAWTPDKSIYTGIDIVGSIFPLVTYNGIHRLFESVGIYGGEHAFTTGVWQFIDGSLGSNASPYATAIWLNPYQECWGKNQMENSRLSGTNFILGESWMQCGNYNVTVLTGSQSYAVTQSNSAWQVYGNDNNLTLRQYPTGTLSDIPLDMGFNNRISTNDASTPGSYRMISIPHSVSPVGQFDGGMALGNSGTPYLNAKDLVLTCDMFGAFTGGYGWSAVQQCTPDPGGTEISQSYVLVTGAGLTGFGTKSNSNWLPGMAIGQRFPMTKMYAVWNGQCVGATSCSGNVTISEYNQSSGTTLQTCTVAFTNAWSIDGGPNSTHPCLVDLTSAAQGQALGWNFGSITGSGLTGVKLATVTFSPIPVDDQVGAAASNDVLASTGNAGQFKTAGFAYTKALRTCGTMTTTAAASNTLSCTWVTTSSTCTITPSNSTAVAWTYYTPTAGNVQVFHASTAGATYAIACSGN